MDAALVILVAGIAIAAALGGLYYHFSRADGGVRSTSGRRDGRLAAIAGLLAAGVLFVPMHVNGIWSLGLRLVIAAAWGLLVLVTIRLALARRR